MFPLLVKGQGLQLTLVLLPAVSDAQFNAQTLAGSSLRNNPAGQVEMYNRAHFFLADS